MTLRSSLLRQLENPRLSVDKRAELSCEVAREFEDKGEYEAARETLSGFWQRIGERPLLEGLEQDVAAELLLRAGVLTSAIGSRQQITDAQEKAKDLISESLTIFESHRYKKKISEAQTELALCYWRTGEINEARDVLKEALSHLTTDSELKARAILRLAIVEHAAAQDDKALRILTNHTSLFKKIQSHTLKGCYHIALGNRLENLAETRKRSEYIDQALIEYAAASYHFEQAEHRYYLATVENNLGFLLYKINRCKEAHEHLDHARRVFASLKDVGAMAQVDETRACVFLAQERVTEAERTARASVRSLENSGQYDLLAEALITHGRALARLDNYSSAFSCFRRTIDLSELTGSLNRPAEAALAAFQEIGEHLGILEGKQLLSGRSLGEEIRSFEHNVIKRALENARGSVTNAARSLGMSYQTLAYMLETRHKDLLNDRTPMRRRPRNSDTKRGYK